jgi:hypothetical protein
MKLSKLGDVLRLIEQYVAFAALAAEIGALDPNGVNLIIHRKGTKAMPIVQTQQ